MKEIRTTQDRVDYILDLFMLHSRHLPSLLICSQGIPGCSPRFSMSRNCRFRLRTKSGCSEVIDQKVSNVISANADTFSNIDSCEIARSIQYSFSLL